MESFYIIFLIICLGSCILKSFHVDSFKTLGFMVRKSSSLQMASYSVNIVNKKRKTEFTIKVPSTKYILDSAEEQAVPIPYSCRAGSCSSCLGRIKSGTVDQSGNIFLSDKHIEEGYVLTCVAYPLEDVSIEVDIEDEFYNLNPDLKVE